MPEDKEESALTINGKKNNVKPDDFRKLVATLGIDQNNFDRVIGQYAAITSKMKKLINLSFLNAETQDKYLKLIEAKMNALGIKISSF
jgi:serine/threonine-protein kinase HipA